MITLEQIALQSMVDHGFIPDFPPPIPEELEAINAPALPGRETRDMRQLLWVSIDNDDSRDLDQLTYAEEGRIFVAVADVDALAGLGSALDMRARHNTTSVYTPTQVFTMFPTKLSYDLSSLNEHCDRLAVVTEMRVAEDGRFELAGVYPAMVNNHAKLAYSNVGEYLEQGISSFKPEIEEQLRLQDDLAQKIQSHRNEEGALHFAEMEVRPIIVNGVPVDLKEKHLNRAHQLIENFMIAANVGVTRFLSDREIPTIRRVVKTPKRWDRIMRVAREKGSDLPAKPDAKALRKFLIEQQKKDPENFRDLSIAIIKLIGRGEYVLGLHGKKHLEHFNLAELEYAHTTAPNRRYPDIVMQRLLKSVFEEKPLPYSKSELTQIAAHCTQKENDANKLERQMVKCAAAMILVKEIGRSFKAMVTGATPKGTWVRLLDFPVEGKLVRGNKGIDVGDHITVKLVKVDIKNGHIDFNRN